MSARCAAPSAPPSGSPRSPSDAPTQEPDPNVLPALSGHRGPMVFRGAPLDPAGRCHPERTPEIVYSTPPADPLHCCALA